MRPTLSQPQGVQSLYSIMKAKDPLCYIKVTAFSVVKKGQVAQYETYGSVILKLFNDIKFIIYGTANC